MHILYNKLAPSYHCTCTGSTVTVNAPRAALLRQRAQWRQFESSLQSRSQRHLPVKPSQARLSPAGAPAVSLTEADRRSAWGWPPAVVREYHSWRRQARADRQSTWQCHTGGPLPVTVVASSGPGLRAGRGTARSDSNLKPVNFGPSRGRRQAGPESPRPARVGERAWV